MPASTYPAKLAARSRTWEKNGAGPKSRAAVTRPGRELWVEFSDSQISADSASRALRAGCEVFHALKGTLHDRGLGTTVGDEGGFAPDLDSNEQALEFLVEGIQAAGYSPGDDVAISGRIGYAAAGYTVLSRGFRSPKVLVEAHRRPQVHQLSRQTDLKGE